MYSWECDNGFELVKNDNYFNVNDDELLVLAGGYDRDRTTSLCPTYHAVFTNSEMYSSLYFSLPFSVLQLHFSPLFSSSLPAFLHTPSI